MREDRGRRLHSQVLSGFVPFIQISDNDHRSIIESSGTCCRASCGVSILVDSAK